MIRSMTGFGEAQVEEDGQLFHVEIRSVNNRYLKASVRLPDELSWMEPQIEGRLRKRVSRGSVTLRVFIRDLSAAAAAELNLEALDRYVTQLRSRYPDLTIDLATLLSLPGICQPHELTEAERQRCQKVVYQLVDEAIEHMVTMRTTEGAALAEDLRLHCEVVRRGVDAIRGRADTAVAALRDRLLQRINELLASSGLQLAQEDLLKEMAVYAERSDVSEELSRLGSHLDQFDGFIAGGEPAGRKLDFISQELLREANTIGSKASDAEIAREVIEIKGAIDRIKEQVQNVE